MLFKHKVFTFISKANCKACNTFWRISRHILNLIYLNYIHTIFSRLHPELAQLLAPLPQLQEYHF